MMSPLPLFPFLDPEALAPSRNIIEEMIAFLNKEMTTPTTFGWYHIMCLGILVLLCVGAVVLFKLRPETNVKLILGITAGVMIVLEIYKQLLFSYTPSSDVWDYQWYAFPFQFCSTPMYIMLIAALSRNEKLSECLYSYLATFSLFAGLAVMIYPGDVFMSYIGINVQTMVHHGAMVLIGVIMYASGAVKPSFKAALSAAYVFAVVVVMATAMNLCFAEFGNGETFNMFFISPIHDCTLPVLSLIRPAVPYAVFFIIYALGFFGIAYLVTLIAKGIMLLSSKLSAKPEVAEEKTGEN